MMETPVTGLVEWAWPRRAPRTVLGLRVIAAWLSAIETALRRRRVQYARELR